MTALLRGAVLLAVLGGCGPRALPPPAPRPTAPRAERVRVRAIRVAVAGRTHDAAEERATMLARMARADDFSDLAVAYGDGERAAELGAGGIVIEAGDETVSPAVRDAALALSPGEVSRAIDGGDAFWVLQRAE
jgi:hypothetical protein